MFPENGATSIVTSITESVSDNWPIFAGMLGLTVGIAIIRKFAGTR